MTTNPAFMELVQSHERSWGMEQYPGRPSLMDMLSRPVVALWSGDDKSGKGRFTITVHDELEALNDLCLGMIVAGKVTPSSTRRLARVFVHQKAVKVTGLRLLFADLNQK